jgi:galactofuranose transport system permease protein
MNLRRSTLVTIGVSLVMFAVFAVQYPNMLSLRILGDLLTDGAYLGVLAVGMLVVICSGGIDLSVAAVMTFVSVFIAVAITKAGVDPVVAFALALVIGATYGALVGAAIHYLEAPPFIVTLTAMFLARGGAIVLSQESVPIRHPLYDQLSAFALPLPGGGEVSLPAMIMVAAFMLGGLLLHRTPFGARVLGIGGDRHAAALMGAPMAQTTIAIYAFSGAMAALAGIVFSLYTRAGYALSAVGVELEAIAACVIGGALLSGGAGSMIGAFFGVLIQGLILTYITFNGGLSSWWTKIAIGALIFCFLLTQRLNAGLGDRPRV